MASSKIKYVHELPVPLRNQLCDILDADKKWEELGRQHMKLKSFTRIYQANNCGKSPSWELLIEFSEKKMGTINKLFSYLHQMNHKRAMDILRPYVGAKYQRLGNENTPSRSQYFLNEEDITCSSMSELNISDTNSLSQRMQKLIDRRYTSGACGTSYKNEDGNLSAINQNRHFDSRRFKRLEAPQVGTKVVSNKSPNLNQVQENTHSEKKSISNMCTLDKVNEERKPCIQEMPLNGEQMKHPQPTPRTNSNSQGEFPDTLKIPYAELCEMTDDFNKARILGEGGFGTVYRGEISHTPVAIKRLSPKKCGKISQEAVSRKQALNEISVLQRYKFNYILPLFAVSLDGEAPCLIYRFMENGSLEDRLLCKNKTSPLTWAERSRIAECTAKGLDFLHTVSKIPVVHGDIKSANILLDKNMEAKIGDFGLTRLGPDCNKTHITVTAHQGTKFYLPDEYLRDRHLSPQVDIYSYGIVMFEVVTGRTCYNEKTNERLIDCVKACATTGTLDSLRDLKAGEENMLWFEELMKIGLGCSSTKKRDRTPMKDVLSKLEIVKTEIAMIKKICHNGAIGAVHPATSRIKDEPLTLKKTGARINNTEESGSYALSDSSCCCDEGLNTSESMRNSEASSSEGKPEAQMRIPPVPLLSDLQAEVRSNKKELNASVHMKNRETSSSEGKFETHQMRIPPVPLLSDLQAEVRSNEKEISASVHMINREASSSEGKSEAHQMRVPPTPSLSNLQAEVRSNEKELNASLHMINREASSSERKSEAHQMRVPPTPSLSNLQAEVRSNEKELNASVHMINREASSSEGKSEAHQMRVPPTPSLSNLQAEVRSNEKELNASVHMINREASSSEGKSEAQIRVPPAPLLSDLQLQAEVPEFEERSDVHESKISWYYRSKMNS